MSEALSALFQEPIDAVRLREQNALEDLLRTRNNQVVLFGCGNLGQRAAGALRSIGVTPLAFTDNNQARWGTEICGLPVLPPRRAVELFGNDATFLITIWNEFHWYQESREQLQTYGADQIAPYLLLHWRFPNIFLPCLLNDLPHKVYQEQDAVLKALELWADQESRSIYEANVRLRALGDFSDLPRRPKENTYLPRDVFSLSESDCFLDCGATSGEMTRDLIQKCGDRFQSFYALEADNISFPKLEAYRESLNDSIRRKLELLNYAVGATAGTVYFEHTGQTGSKIASAGLPVECCTIDELFRDRPLTFIKMDIEGAEFDALRGAVQVLQRDRPILAICVYHTQSDIWRIPLLVHEVLPEHLLFLRAYEGDGYQTVLYAVPPERRAA